MSRKMTEKQAHAAAQAANSKSSREASEAAALDKKEDGPQFDATVYARHVHTASTRGAALYDSSLSAHLDFGREALECVLCLMLPGAPLKESESPWNRAVADITERASAEWFASEGSAFRPADDMAVVLFHDAVVALGIAPAIIARVPFRRVLKMLIWLGSLEKTQARYAFFPGAADWVKQHIGKNATKPNGRCDTKPEALAAALTEWREAAHKADPDHVPAPPKPHGIAGQRGSAPAKKPTPFAPILHKSSTEAKAAALVWVRAKFATDRSAKRLAYLERFIGVLSAELAAARDRQAKKAARLAKKKNAA